MLITCSCAQNVQVWAVIASTRLPSLALMHLATRLCARLQ